ncbi:MAG: hypothetical protein JO297_17065 [Nitrososphaeraceae archaeon]|nr:hypothetical protein [Nitrososphaeraceae archaeon]
MMTVIQEICARMGLVTSNGLGVIKKNCSEIITYNQTPFALIRFENYAAVYELRAYTNKPNEYLKIQSEFRNKIYDLLQIHELYFTIPQAQINVDENENREEV